MPVLGSPTIETLTELRDHVALWMGAAAYANLETEEQSIVNISIARALRDISRQIKGVWSEREKSFTVGINKAGNEATVAATANVVVGDATVDAVSVNLTTKGIVSGDRVKLAGDGFFTVDSVTDSDTLELTTEYSGATTTGLSVTFGRDTYELASGVIWLRGLYEVDSGDPIEIIENTDWLEATGGTWETGTPRYACLLPSDASGGAGTEQKIRLWPVPDSIIAYTYYYYTLPTMPASGSARFETSPSMSDLLIHKTLEYVYWHRQEPEERDRHSIEYSRLVKQAMGEEINRGVSLVRMMPQWDENLPYRPRRPNTIVSPFPVGV